MKKILLIILVTIINAYSLNKIIYISPLPGSKYINPQNNIIIGFREPVLLSASEIVNNLVISGSSGRNYEGKIILTEDNRKIIIKPLSNFQKGETVTVEFSGSFAAAVRSIIKEKRYSFSVDNNENKWFPGYSMEKEIPTGQFNFPDVPAMNVTVNNNPSVGFIFSAPWFINTYLLISTRFGLPHWYQEQVRFNADFKKQPNGDITYFSNTEQKFIELNTTYDILKTYSCGNGYATDVHELRILNNGHSLLMAYDPREVDMSQVVPGGHPRASVTGLIIQEIDNDTNVVFQWRSWDHFLITDALHEDLTDSVIDYVHGNAIEADSDGNLMISSRHLDEITKINRITGNIIWRLGGKNNQFTFINDTVKFCYQHAIRRIANGNITLYDNGNYHIPQYSRALEYQLDEVNKTAALVWQYRNNPDIFGVWGGYVQRLPEGNTLISWGGAGTALTEVTAGGIKVFEASFPSGYYTYRAYKYDWSGGPVAVNSQTGFIPSEFIMEQNYPNPFNPVTNINFSVPVSAFVKISVFDALGREVSVLVNQEILPGRYKTEFDGSLFSSGVYFYRISTGEMSQTKKMVLIK